MAWISFQADLMKEPGSARDTVSAVLQDAVSAKYTAKVYDFLLFQSYSPWYCFHLSPSSCFLKVSIYISPFELQGWGWVAI